MIRFLLLFINIIVFSFSCLSDTIIEDAEINNVIKKIAAPILKVANLNKVEILLINNNDINAYARVDNKIFIYSGLIKSFPDPEILRGVISHEVGHISSKHVVKTIDAAQNYSLLTLSSVIGAIAASVITKSSELPLSMMLSAQEYVRKSLLKFSRSCEFAADNVALSMLEQAGYSSIGLVKLLENFNNQILPSDVNLYEQTHPPSRERLKIVKNFYNNSKCKNNLSSESMVRDYKRAAAKLEAYTESIDIVLKKYNKVKLNQDLRKYIETIIYFRQGKTKQALKNIHYLTQKFSLDPYYWELQGDILFQDGDKRAVNSYDKALEILGDDDLIKLSRAISAITLYPKNAIPKKYFLDITELSSKIHDATVFYFISLYHEKMGNKAKSLVAAAIFCKKVGYIEKAKQLAKMAIKQLEPKTVDWYKAQDLIFDK